jgi:hypothetical protein
MANIPNSNNLPDNTNTSGSFTNIPPVSVKAVATREFERVVPPHDKISLGTLEFRPRNISFATQNKGERIYVLVRRHWITNIGWIVRGLFYAIVPFVVLGVLNVFSVDLDFLPTRALVLIIIFYMSLVLTTMIKDFLDWFYDPYIVTNERVLDYDFRPFSSYTIKETSLANIENVKESSGGVLGNIFNYGDVTILTASSTLKGELNFIDVPSSSDVRNVISDLATIYKKFEYGDRRFN